MRKILLVLWLAPFSLFGQNSGKACEILSKINALMQREHYRPKPVDDSLSVYVFDEFMDRLDQNRILFTKTEYQKLSRHRLLIDNYIVDQNCAFMDEFSAMYKTALLRKKAVIEKIRKEILDYNSKDSIRFSKDNFPFDLSETDLDRVWRKRIRFEILEDISKLSTNRDSLKLKFISLEKKSRDKVFETNLCKVNSILDNKDDFEATLQNDLLNIFCNYFDPHSNYFSLDAKTSFMSSLSTSNLSIGLNVGLNENEEIVVEEIIPGGPAAKSQKIEKEDVIVKVSNKKGQEYWVSCASLETIGDLMFSDANKEIGLTVRKKNGSMLDIDLEKQVMKASENSVYSFIAEKEARVGYINIPSFYSDFEGHSVQGCADDVAKEIVKLQKENIEGLVIDLQDDGGGSMEEAIKLAGMFIDYGPISVLSDHTGNQTILKDMNRGSLYNGPLVVLINGSSASASEFFTAAMQDYNRATVIGATSLGKASMQVIMPVEENNQENFVKITTQKFYRISGDSNQIRGVIPDVHLPVLFDSLTPRERSYRTALKYDRIQTKARFQPFPVDYTSKIAAMSNERAKASQRFSELSKINEEINLVYNNPKPPVRIVFNDVFKEVHTVDGLWKKVKAITDKPTGCRISNTAYEKEKIQFDTLQQEVNAYKIKDVSTNPYLEEAVAIIHDYNNLKNK